MLRLDGGFPSVALVGVFAIGRSRGGRGTLLLTAGGVTRSTRT